LGLTDSNDQRMTQVFNRNPGLGRIETDVFGTRQGLQKFFFILLKCLCD